MSLVVFKTMEMIMNSNFIADLIAEANKSVSGIHDLEILETETGLFPGSSSATAGDCCPDVMPIGSCPR